MTDPHLEQRLRQELDGISPRRQAIDRAFVNFVDGLGDLVARHWLLFFNLSCVLVLAGAVAVAYLRSVGADGLAEELSTVYLLLCPQRPTHSYFLFGAQMGLEHREVAMFGAQLAGGLMFALAPGRLPRLPGLMFAFLSLPIAWDIASQMAGVRESDWLTRTWTGALFNLAFVLWAYPALHVLMRRSRARRTVVG